MNRTIFAAAVTALLCTQSIAETVPTPDAGAIRRDFKAQGYDFNHPAYLGAYGTQTAPAVIVTTTPGTAAIPAVSGKTPDVFSNTPSTLEHDAQRCVTKSGLIAASAYGFIDGAPWCTPQTISKDMNHPSASQGVPFTIPGVAGTPAVTTSTPGCKTSTVLFTDNGNGTTSINRGSSTAAGAC